MRANSFLPLVLRLFSEALCLLPPSWENTWLEDWLRWLCTTTLRALITVGRGAHQVSLHLFISFIFCAKIVNLLLIIVLTPLRLIWIHRVRSRRFLFRLRNSANYQIMACVSEFYVFRLLRCDEWANVHLQSNGTKSSANWPVTIYAHNSCSWKSCCLNECLFAPLLILQC